MSDDRRKLAAEWRRAMRKGDDESVSPLLDSWILRGGRGRMTYGGLGDLGGAIRKLGMVRSGLIAFGIALWAISLARLERLTGFPAAYGIQCHGRACGLAQYVHSPRLLTNGAAAEIALFVSIWLPFVAVGALFLSAFRARRRRPSTRARRASPDRLP